MYRFLMEHLSGQLVYGMELVGKNAVALAKEILGDKDPIKAKPGTIRALYGTDPVKNCVDVSTDAKTAIQVFILYCQRLNLPNF